jgi:hypothetical protein
MVLAFLKAFVPGGMYEANRYGFINISTTKSNTTKIRNCC